MSDIFIKFELDDARIESAAAHLYEWVGMEAPFEWEDAEFEAKERYRQAVREMFDMLFHGSCA